MEEVTGFANMAPLTLEKARSLLAQAGLFGV